VFLEFYEVVLGCGFIYDFYVRFSIYVFYGSYDMSVSKLSLFFVEHVQLYIGTNYICFPIFFVTDNLSILFLIIISSIQCN